MKIHKAIINGYRNIINEVSIPFNKGVNMLTGKNGTGKSTIFDSVYWCLYGKSNRSTGEYSVLPLKKIRPEGYQGAEVIVFVTNDKGVEYAIKRTYNLKKKTVIVVEEIGKCHHNFDHVSDAQQFIDTKVMGMDAKQYLSMVYIGQGMARFMQQSTADRAVLLDKLFDLMDFEGAKKLAAEKQQQLQQEISVLTNTINVETTNSLHVRELLAVKATEIKVFDEKKAEDARKLEAQIAELTQDTRPRAVLILGTAQKTIDRVTVEKSECEAELETLRATIQAPAPIVASPTPLQDEYHRIQKIYNTQESEYKAAYTKHENAVNAKAQLTPVTAGKCPTCAGTMNKEAYEKLKTEYDTKTAAFNNTIDSHALMLPALYEELMQTNEKVKEATAAAVGEAEIESKRVSKLKAEAAVGQQKLEGLEYKLKSLSSAITTQQNIHQEAEGRIKHQDALLVQLNKDLVDTNARVFKSNIAQTKEELTAKLAEHLKTLEESKTKNTEYTEVMEVVEFWYKKGFSNSGIKAFLYSHYLQRLNDSIAIYAEQFNVRVTMSISLGTQRKSLVVKCAVGENERDYNLLSGGEQTTVDLAILFGVIEMVNNTYVDSKVNLLILDESFTGLDTSNLQTALGILRSLKRDVYVCSHYDFNEIYEVNRLKVTKLPTGGIQIEEL